MQQRAYASRSSQPSRFPPIFPSADGISPQFQPRPAFFVVFSPSPSYIRNGELALFLAPTHHTQIAEHTHRVRLRKPKDCRSVLGLLLGWPRGQWRLTGRRRRRCYWTRPRARAASRSSSSRLRSRKPPRRTLLCCFLFLFLVRALSGLVLGLVRTLGWIHEVIPRNGEGFHSDSALTRCRSKLSLVCRKSLDLSWELGFVKTG